MTRPNNVATNYGYDNQSRLLSVLHQLSGSTIDGATYTVDSAGNRTAKTDNRANVTSNYGYDAIYELLQTTQGGTTTESYTYDPVGNRLTSLGVSSYSNNLSNELTSTPSASYTYDNNGNTLTKTTSGSTTNYTWDYENRLATVVLPGTGGTATFKYDPFGRRIEKTTSSTTSIYAYDGDNLVEETNATGAVVARYSQTQNIDEPLAMLRSSATSYYHADGLGSISSLSNAAGSIANTYAYDSFGKLTASTGSLVNPFQYTAREFDTETSLYYYRSRYMDASTGRFLSEDPIAFLAGTNFYTYVENDPVGWADPTGQQKCKKACGIKKGPEYNVSGTVPGGTGFTFHAEFLNDDEHSPSCCEVRQLISWTQGGPPNHHGFYPPGNFQSGGWYEDRDANNCRYGRRTGLFGCLPVGPGNNYNGNNYDGADWPNIHHHVLLGFRLIVVDICQGGKTIYTSKTIHVQF
jgi:RHS repeat-associated protein